MLITFARAVAMDPELAAAWAEQLPSHYKRVSLNYKDVEYDTYTGLLANTTNHLLLGTYISFIPEEKVLERVFLRRLLLSRDYEYLLTKAGRGRI